MSDERTQAQLRFSAAMHEASHLTIAHLLGHGAWIDEVLINDLGGGHIQYRPGLPRPGLLEAIDLATVALAGAAGVRASWAAELFADEEIGGRPRELADLSDEELLIFTGADGSDPVAGNARHAMYMAANSPDEETAQRLVAEVTENREEGAALMLFVRARTARLVSSPRFLAIAHRLAAVVLDRGKIDGNLARHHLDRGEVLFRLREET